MMTFATLAPWRPDLDWFVMVHFVTIGRADHILLYATWQVQVLPYLDPLPVGPPVVKWNVCQQVPSIFVKAY